MANGSVTRITVGSCDFSLGVDSNRVPTQRSADNPNGMPLSMLAWANNVTVRGNGISPRKGFLKLAAFAQGIGLFQEAFMYQPRFAFPYIVAQIGGRTFKVDLETYVITEITIPGDPNPPDRDQAWMVQGEEFLIIQDGISLPLFWDGATLRRSIGNPQALGIVGVAGVAPAVGSSVLLTLASPFTGSPGQIVILNGQVYTVGASGNFITIRNDANGSIGSTVPTGSTINPTAQPQMLTMSPFVIPPLTASVVVQVNNAYTGPTPNTAGVTNAILNWTITAAGTPAAGANQVYLTNVSDVPTSPIVATARITSVGELPAGEPMTYYQGRIWIALGREYLAGDIVRGPSGTAPYQLRDSILKMTENQYIALGGTFTVPTNAGNIRALNYPANQNSVLGSGPLLIFTREQIYAADVPISRAAWSATDGTGFVQKVAQINFGTTSDRSVVHVNGDVFMQSPAGVRSFTTAVRNFGEWGNTPISSEVDRAVSRNDRALLRFGSGIDFDNRLLETCLPYQTDVGVAHRAIIALDFDLISTLATKLPPAWEGVLEGLAHLRLLRGDFGGLQRAFSICRGQSGAIEVWEMSSVAIEDSNDSGDARVTWSFETPSYSWGTPFQLKELDTVEYWVDQLHGNVEITWQFRPDQHACWEPYWKHQICAPRNNCEDCGVLLPDACYPEQLYPRQYRAHIVLPKPPTRCETSQGRPINIGYAFQFRVFVKGQMRVRGLMVHGLPRDKTPYESVTNVCSNVGCGP